MLYAAAALFILLGLAHSILGERYILTRLFRRGELPKIFGGTEFTKGTLRFTWHVTTLLGFSIAAVLFQIASAGSVHSMVAVIGWTSVLTGVLPIYFTKGKHLSWIGFFAAGALCLWWAAN